MVATRNRARSAPVIEIAELLPSWRLALRAERKSKATITNYTNGLQQFIAWCESAGHTPALKRELVQLFVADLLDSGAEPTTARARQLAVRRFTSWCVEENILDSDPLAGLRPPKLDTKVTRCLDEDEIRELVKACGGKLFRDIRDTAMVRLMVESGLRAGEVVELKMTDVDLQRGMLTVVRGKGFKSRLVPFGVQTARALDRYIRARRDHPLAGTTPKLFLGERGTVFGYAALDRALKVRAQRAGIHGFHAHLLRHAFASRWLAAKGSEGGLMAVAGWSDRSMLDRYSRSTASERAAAEARDLKLGEY